MVTIVYMHVNVWCGVSVGFLSGAFWVDNVALHFWGARCAQTHSHTGRCSSLREGNLALTIITMAIATQVDDSVGLNVYNVRAGWEKKEKMQLFENNRKHMCPN